MNKTKQALTKLESALEEVIERREGIFDNHTERWRESEKGEEYQERTDKLQEMREQVTDWILEFDE